MADDAGSGDTGNAVWHSTFQGEDLGWLQNRGLTNLDASAAMAALMQSYRAAEGKLGAPADQLVRLPKDGDPDSQNNFWTKAGRPAKADEYDFGFDLKEADVSITDLANAMRENAFKYNLPKPAIEGFMKAMREFDAAQDAKTTEVEAAQLETLKAELKASWGDHYNENMAVAQRTAAKLGVDEAMINALENTLGFSKAMEMFRAIGTKIQFGEDDFKASDPGKSPHVVTKEQALSKIAALRNDGDFRARLMKGDANAQLEWNQLHQAAFDHKG